MGGSGGLLHSTGRLPLDLREWLGPGWSGTAADAFDAWARQFEAATRRAAAALAEAATLAGQAAAGARIAPPRGGLAPAMCDRLDRGLRAVMAVPVPGEPTPATSATGPPGSDIERPESDASPPTSDAAPLKPDAGPPASEAGPLTHDARPPESGGSPVPDERTSGARSDADKPASGEARLQHHSPAVIPMTRPADGPAPNHPPDRVAGWIDQAVRILRECGYRPDQTDPEAIATIIRHESSGNPAAVNRWDDNAARGTPSMGLMQTIGPTFRRYHLPGHDQILNPVDNIIAGVRYAVDRYGSVSRAPGVLTVAAGRGYRGY